MSTSTTPCRRCQTWMHPPPDCDHDSTAPCSSCGKPKGYRFIADNGQLAPGDICYICYWGRE